MAESPAPRRRTRRVTGPQNGLANGARPRRGRPPGSKNKRPAGSSPATSLARRIEALVKENDELRATVKELQAAFRKIESALGARVTRPRVVSRPTGKRRGRPPKAPNPDEVD